MNIKRMAILIVAFSLLCMGTAFAGKLTYEWYLAKKVTFKMNNVDQNMTGLAVDVENERKDSKALPMADVENLTNVLGGFVSYDYEKGQVDIYKPNVQLLVYANNNKDPFGRVTKGDKIGINVFAQVDSLHVDISSFKYVLSDPFGKEIASKEITVDKQQESFFSNMDLKIITFEYTGKYTVNMYMKAVNSNNYVLVSQLGIYSGQ